MQVLPVVLNGGLHGVLHNFEGHMVDVGGDVHHRHPKDNIKVKKIIIAGKQPSLVLRRGDVVTFYLQLRSCEVAAFTEHLRVVVSKSDGGFHIEFRVDHPHLVLHLAFTPVIKRTALQSSPSLHARRPSDAAL